MEDSQQILDKIKDIRKVADSFDPHFAQNIKQISYSIKDTMQVNLLLEGMIHNKNSSQVSEDSMKKFRHEIRNSLFIILNYLDLSDKRNFEKMTYEDKRDHDRIRQQIGKILDKMDNLYSV